MNQSEVAALMESSRSETEWNNNCDKVKAACGGYPDFWYSAVVVSGLAKRVMARFGASPEIEIVSLSGGDR